MAAPHPGRVGTNSSGDVEDVNEVVLVGRISAEPVRREFPSGGVLVSFRVVVRRPDGDANGRGVVDWIDCITWGGRVQRQAMTWSVGDIVGVEGRLRRRFLRTDPPTSRLEVEVNSGRRLRRGGVARGESEHATPA